MMHKLLADARFYLALLQIDRDLARAARDAGCSCEGSGTLHAAHYPRRPHGGPAALPEGYERRFSFCCGLEDCRARTTPPSVRFFGRRWYLAPVVVLVSALRHGVTPRRLAALREWLSSRGERLAGQTVERWRRWWLETFPATPTWEAGRGRFAPAVVEALLPQSLLERFAGDDRERLAAALRFLSPVTTGFCARFLTGPPRR
jgi:hypothetical protein